MFSHSGQVLLRQQGGGLTLTDDLHNLKCHLRLQTLVHQVYHDTVTGTDNGGNIASTRLNQVLCIAQPHVGAVGQTGYLHQVGEGLRLTIQQHLAGKAGTHLGNGQRTRFAAQLFHRQAQRFGRGKQAIHRRIGHIDVLNRDAGVLFQILTDGRNHVTQVIQLQDGIVNRMEIEVSGDDTRIHLARRVLNGTEILYLIVVGHNHHTTGMLTGGTLNAGATDSQAIQLGRAKYQTTFFGILFHVTESGLVCNGADGTGLEHVVQAEQRFRIAVCAVLILTGEVKIDIGRFVAIKAKEGFKRNLLTVTSHHLSALGTRLGRQVKAGTHLAVDKELGMFTLRIAAHIVRLQGIHLGNTRQMRHDGGTDRTTATHQIAVIHRVLHQFLCNHIQHGKAVLNDGVQLFLQSSRHDLRDGIAIDFLCLIPAQLLQLIIRTGDMGRIGTERNGANLLHHIRDTIGVLNNHLASLLVAQVGEFLKHLLCGTEIQRRLIICIVKAHTGHQNTAVHLVLRFHKVHVTSSTHRFVQGFAQAQDRARMFLQFLLALANRRLNHATLTLGGTQQEIVVAQRLNL